MSGLAILGLVLLYGACFVFFYAVSRVPFGGGYGMAEGNIFGLKYMKEVGWLMLVPAFIAALPIVGVIVAIQGGFN